MDRRCDYCGDPAVAGRPDPPWCARCWEWYAEYQRRWEEVQRAGRIWNPSQDDPWCRSWLLSRELFDAYHDAAPRLGERVRSALSGGDLFDYGRSQPVGFGCRVLIWASPT